LTLLPAGAAIVSAEFKLTKTGGDTTTSITQHIHKVNQFWTEGGAICVGAPGEASWNHREPGILWGTPGGDYGGSIASVPIKENQEYTWASAALTALVDEWFPGITPNYGFIIGSPDVGTQDRVFASWGHLTAGHPTLVVNYRLP